MPDDTQQRIAELEELQRLGVTSINVDGISVSIDPQVVARQLRGLRQADPLRTSRRPVAARINLSSS